MKVIFNYATRQFEPMEPSMNDRFDLKRLKAAVPLLAPALLPAAAAFLGLSGTGLVLQQKIQNYFENNPEALPKFKEYLKTTGVALPFGTLPGDQPDVEEELKELSKPVGFPAKKQEKPKSEGTKIPEPKKDKPPGIEPPDVLPDLPGFSKDEEAKSPQIFTLTEGLFDDFDIGDPLKQKKPRVEKITKKQQKEPLPKDFTELLDDQDEAAMKIAEMYRDREFNNPNLYKLFRDYTLKFHNGNSINAAKDFPFVKEINEKLQSQARNRGFKIQFGYGKKRAPIIKVDDQPFKFDSELTDYIQKNPNYLQDRIKKLKQFDKEGFYTTSQIAEILGIANDPYADSRVNRFIQKYEVGKGAPYTNKPVRSKAGTYAKSPLYSLEDVVRNIEAFSKNKPDKDRIRTDAPQLRKIALANFDDGLYSTRGDSIVAAITRSKGEFFKELESDEVRNLLNQSVNYNIGHQVPVAFMSEKGFQLPIAKIPENMDKLYGLNTLVFQDAKINYELGNIQGKDTTLMKTINDFLEANQGKTVDFELFKTIKKINEESEDVQKFKQDRVKEFLNEVYTVGNKKAKRLVHEPYLKDQDKTIAKVILDLKPGDTVELTSIDVDMSDVPNRLRFGQINTINSEANKTKDLSKEELAKYEKNISSQIRNYYEDVAGAAGLKGIVEDEEFNEVAEIENMINDKFGLGTMTTADKAPEPDSSILRRLFKEFKERRGFAEGTPSPLESEATIDQALAALNSSEVRKQFFYDTSPMGKLDKSIFGKDGDRNMIQQFNTQFLDPRSYPYYGQKILRGAANIPEFIFSTPKAGLAFIQDLRQNAGITKEGVEEILEILDPSITRDFLNGEFGDLLGLSDKAIQASEEKRTGPQRTTGSLLQLAGELPGPATPIFLLGYAPKLLKQLGSLGATGSTAIEKINKEIENKVAQQGVDQTRRDIVLSIGAGGAVAFLKYLGLDFLSKAPRAVEKVAPTITKGGTPKYFFDFVSLIKKKGDDITEEAATLERQKVYNYKGYELTEDISTGKISIRKDTEGSASYYIGDGEYDTIDGIVRKEEITYDPPETILDDSGKPKRVPDSYEENTLKPDIDGGEGDAEAGLDSIDEILELLSKDGKTYSKDELLEMGIDADALGNYPTGAGSIPEGRIGEADPFKTKKAGGGIIKLAGDDSGPPPKSGPTPHGLPYVAKNVRPIKERK